MKAITDFIFELGQLKRESHSGYKLAGVKHPPSIAEHVFRAAQIGYFLAVHEGANPERVACIVLFHDNAESRLRDLHRVATRYLPKGAKAKAEVRIEQEQIADLGPAIERRLFSYFNCEGKERQLAKEADELEMAFTAKELVETGYSAAQDWIENVKLILESETARAIMAELEKASFTDWWKGLKDLTKPLQKVS